MHNQQYVDQTETGDDDIPPQLESQSRSQSQPLSQPESFGSQPSGCSQSSENSTDDDFFELEDAEINAELDNWSFTDAQKVVDYCNEHPNFSFHSIQRRFRRIKDRKTIFRLQEIVKKGGTMREKLDLINNYALNKYNEARNQYKPVHGIDVRRWAREKASLLKINFKASPTWLYNFTTRNQIVSRKVTKLITVSRAENAENIEKSAEAFRDAVQEELINYMPDMIFNSDQSGYSYEFHSTRTLSSVGEKDTFLAVTSMNRISHSYTIQPILDFCVSRR